MLRSRKIIFSLLFPYFTLAKFISGPESSIHCKKKFSDFPVPSRDVTNQTFSVGESILAFNVLVVYMAGGT
jgi:hypothetical protein